MIVTVHATPRRHVSYVVSYVGLRPQSSVRGIAQADARGIVSFSVRVVPGPANGAASLSGSISARIADANASGATSARFRVFPALHLVTGSRIVTKNGAMTMVVRVQVAVRAQVLVTVTVSGMRPPALTARGTVDGQHRLDLSLALGSLHGPAEAHVVVVVKTKDGVTATHNVSVMVRS